MSDHVLTLNAGSSSVKFALFAVEPDGPLLVAGGQAEGLGAEPLFHARVVGGPACDSALASNDHQGAINAIVDWVDETLPRAVIAAVGHRVVHGGVCYAAPIIVDDAALAALETLAPLAPLHQRHNLSGIRAARRAFPGEPQIACFDTAFHRGHDFLNEVYALPRAFYERGLRRFGFHGLSYEFISLRLRDVDPVVAGGRVIVAHLGNGASICAMKDGRSVASTMGFSALEGLPMGTRCGRIDPGLLLYLLEHDKMSVDGLSQLLYRESGLLGLSGLSQDMRTLEASDSAQAREAIDYFVHHICMEIAALAAVLKGLDALVFTGGIGEHSPHVRAAVIESLKWLGFALDAPANAGNAPLISSSASRAPVYVIATDEESMIARHAIDAAGLARAVAA
ncbi:acetate/propionate family kinase [Methylocystis parvus]|uniref:Acetate kinase n=1 Tax=Methylocystis parvus TaxID=134 RepID=A0A6B8M5W8_9HYPH|nr:acetate/propionate family kinase [Methylocystis parvus]QGM97745.1 acetate/propionate family kinase [Methylocystis parvus]WBK01952.1 acetate/propionate family kinase [Methylocystis parvus OBBP]